jgi:undecaprenyl-diphosphatase
MLVPGAETTASFPSGHTIGTATLLLVVGYLVCSRRPTAARLVTAAVVALVGTGLVALSRLYLGYHFLTDVVAAAALAVAVLGLVMLVDRLRTGPPSG